MELELVTHVFPPLFDQQCRVLMLGSIPSPKSRELGFYYGHPRNRFWKVISDVCDEPVPETIEEKKALALRNHIAIWDVLEQCQIRGADDSSIRNPIANDMDLILKQAPIQAVFTTGTKAAAYYEKYCLPKCGVPAITLPSTSPANCRITYEELKKAYSQILSYINEQ
ncbi:MAG: DNA-deoxyinosine glycosylase [Lachnospiraceae bacterium]